MLSGWLTLVHGFTQNHKIFARQAERFASQYNIHQPDLLGHGTKSDYLGPIGVTEYSADILRSMDEKEIEKTHLWGTHTGSAVGLYLAYHYSDRITSLVLEGAVIPGVAVPVVVSQFERLKRIAHSEGIEAAMIDWYEDAGWFDVIRKHPEKCRAKHQLDILGEFKGGPVFCVEEAAPIDFSIDKLKQISQPALVYNGSEDLPDFKEMAIILGDEILNVKRCVLEGLGGFPLWEDPVRVNSMVERFLNQL